MRCFTLLPEISDSGEKGRRMKSRRVKRERAEIKSLYLVSFFLPNPYGFSSQIVLELSMARVFFSMEGLIEFLKSQLGDLGGGFHIDLVIVF